MSTRYYSYRDENGAPWTPLDKDPGTRQHIAATVLPSGEVASTVRTHSEAITLRLTAHDATCDDQIVLIEDLRALASTLIYTADELEAEARDERMR